MATDTLENKFAQTLHQTRNVDRILPTQPALSQHFTGTTTDFFNRLEALLLSVLPVRSIEEKWDIRLKPGLTYASLGSDINTLHFYQLLIRMGNIKSILEVGTYVGVSALFLAEAAGPSGRVTTIEYGQEFYDIAKENVARNGYSARIHLIRGDGVQYVHEFADAKKRYGMILIDAAKEHYAKMLEPALACLEPGGLLLVDDVFFHGDTLNDAPASEKGQGVQKLLHELAAYGDTYTKVILPIGNGLLLIHSERE